MFPHMVLIHNQEYNSQRLEDVEKEFEKGFESLRLSAEEIRGKKIGIAVGSRGIDRIQQIVRMTVEAVKAAGGEPFIFGAMGSHGNGTAQGQREILASLGVTEEETGAPVLCSAQTALWGATGQHGYKVYGNELCDRFDAIILVNRVKMHTDFEDVTESGVLKLMAIGIGGPAGCQNVHTLALKDGYGTVIRETAAFMMEKLPVLFGVLLTENAVHELDGIYMERPEKFLETEKRLLEKVKRGRMKLPSDSIDVLIVDEMGKNISGSGMDTKVIGRVYVTGQAEPKNPRASRVVVLGLTEESHGNAIGIGLADFSTREVLDKIDFAATAKNAVASMAPAQGKIPCILENDREAIRAALDTAAIEDMEKARVVRIQNTNQIARLYVSEALYEELRENPKIQVMEGSAPMAFDRQGKLAPGHYGKGEE
uniref:hypothetical protein n=1 Tax=Lachnoclostridium phocaeense TaxID=1871021 RepID=UPI0026DC28DE|nr:hypothetical protein [Lachnoclostridium phocaeense]